MEESLRTDDFKSALEKYLPHDKDHADEVSEKCHAADKDETYAGDCGKASDFTKDTAADHDISCDAADTMTEQDIKEAPSEAYLMSGLTLAYIGDAVFELMVRKYMIGHGSRQADKLHKHTTNIVNAKMQSDIIIAVTEHLTEKEMSVFKRGRNSSTATAAKNQKLSDYRRATGLEALFGYLYLDGQDERLKAVFDMCMEAAMSIQAGTK